MTDPYRPEETVAPVPSTSGVSPGSLIRGARERALMSQDELAAQLRLSRATLDAIEHDNFAALSEPVYIRGYYRKCAKFLNISEAELLAAYERVAVRKGAPAPTKLLLAGNDEGGRSHGGAKWLLWGVAIVVVIVIIGSLVHKHGEPAAPAGSATTSTSDADTAPPTPESSSASAAAQAEQLRPAERAPVPAPALTPAPVPAPATPAASPSVTPRTSAPTPPAVEPAPPAPAAVVRSDAPAPVKQHQLPPAQQHIDHDQMAAAVLPKPAAETSVPVPAANAAEMRLPLQVHIRATSWVHIEDANGKLLISRMMHPGDNQRVMGPAPYLVFVGYAPGVDLQYGDANIDLQPYSRDNSTARLKVPTETPQ